jgi:hypothetical protein
MARGRCCCGNADRQQAFPKIVLACIQVFPTGRTGKLDKITSFSLLFSMKSTAQKRYYQGL